MRLTGCWTFSSMLRHIEGSIIKLHTCQTAHRSVAECERQDGGGQHSKKFNALHAAGPEAEHSPAHLLTLWERLHQVKATGALWRLHCREISGQLCKSEAVYQQRAQRVPHCGCAGTVYSLSRQRPRICRIPHKQHHLILVAPVNGDHLHRHMQEGSNSSNVGRMVSACEQTQPSVPTFPASAAMLVASPRPTWLLLTPATVSVWCSFCQVSLPYRLPTRHC